MPITHEKCTPSLVIREMKIKTVTRYHLMPTRRAITKSDNRSIGKMWRNWGPLTFLVEM